MTGLRSDHAVPAVDWRGFLWWAFLIAVISAAALALIP